MTAHSGFAAAHDQELAIVLSGDGNEQFGRGLAVTLHSALALLSPRCGAGVYLLDCGVGEQTRAKLERVASRARPGVEIRWIEVDPRRLAGLPTKARFPLVVYARLLIPDLLPANVGRAVFLDGDLLVRRDLLPLFELDLEGAPLAAVQDLGEAGGDRTHGDRYFNGGLLVIDVPAWRRESVPRRVTEYVEAHEILAFQDQDALNAVIDQWHELDCSWNLQLGGLVPGAPEGWMTHNDLDAHYRAMRHRPAILHFTVAKPWMPSQGGPGAWAWARYAARTGWDAPASALLWTSGWLARRGRLWVGTWRQRIGQRMRGRHRVAL